MTRLSPIHLPQTATPDPPPTLAAVLAGWPRILLCIVLLVGLAGISLGSLAVPTWRASSTLMLNPQEQTLIDLGRVLPALGRDAQILNTQTEVLKSRLLLGRVVDDLGLVEVAEFNPARRPEGSLSPAVLKRRIAGWLGYDAAPPAPLLPAAERDETIRTLLRKLDIAVEPDSLVIAVSLTSRSAEQSAAIVNHLLETYVADQRAAKLAATESATSWLTERVVQLKATLEQAEAAARAARAETGVRTSDQLSEMERRLAALSERRADPGRTDGEQARLKAEADELARQIHDASARLVKTAQLEREARASALLYENFLARLKETAIQTDAHTADAVILSPAVAPRQPHSPRVPLVLALAVILGGGLGTIWVLIREEWRLRFRTPEELERASGMRTLAVVPEPATRHCDPLEDIDRRPGGALAESLRDLRSSLLLSNLDKPPRVIAVTSSLPEEGKTTLAILLAQSLAAWDKSVLLIEADIRGATIADRLGLGEQRGILSVLARLCEVDEVIHKPPTAGFDVIPGERTAANGADIFSTGRFATFLEQMRGRYDYIVIDTPPVLAAADARVIAPVVDAVIYAVRWNRTTRAQMRRGIDQFRNFGLPLTGLVLSRANLRRVTYGGAGGRGD
ncbi:exopolysaccharide transport family protein [Oceanibium sediminis]|uniref:exopolysaccharide transport family protein n=1 Tax=Oceanibium sediminis TaxID=2026339 RepID=UPI000DD4AF40|nr:polysaccharide biosynthesis tyrosine autokinase [Oceanibium sediminis]